MTIYEFFDIVFWVVGIGAAVGAVVVIGFICWAWWMFKDHDDLNPNN